MFCNHCGAEIKDGVKFCDKCGGKIEVARPQSVNADANTQAEKSVAVTPAQNETQANSAEQPPVGTGVENKEKTSILDTVETICYFIFAIFGLLYLVGLLRGAIPLLLAFTCGLAGVIIGYIKKKNSKK